MANYPHPLINRGYLAPSVPAIPAPAGGVRDSNGPGVAYTVNGQVRVGTKFWGRFAILV